eukprot:GHVQ01003031.1.p1 GENE.GHVQ01003031.1~~GHVQ01003031.1.p1  ORF type:complete len:336 (+),score=80.24 GHVQ01003031.1:232-1239(+)
MTERCMTTSSVREASSPSSCYRLQMVFNHLRVTTPSQQDQQLQLQQPQLQQQQLHQQQLQELPQRIQKPQQQKQQQQIQQPHRLPQTSTTIDCQIPQHRPQQTPLQQPQQLLQHPQHHHHNHPNNCHHLPCQKCHSPPPAMSRDNPPWDLLPPTSPLPDPRGALPALVPPPLTTHVLNTATGFPAVGMPVCVEVWEDTFGLAEDSHCEGCIVAEGECAVCRCRGRAVGGAGEGGRLKGRWVLVRRVVTNADGRVSGRLLGNQQMLYAGTIYRMTFDTSAYFEGVKSAASCGEGASSCARCFYPHVQVTFEVTEDTQHYHVPLLVSPYGYSTYRGS